MTHLQVTRINASKFKIKKRQNQKKKKKLESEFTAVKSTIEFELAQPRQRITDLLRKWKVLLPLRRSNNWAGRESLMLHLRRFFGRVNHTHGPVYATLLTRASPWVALSHITDLGAWHIKQQCTSNTVINSKYTRHAVHEKCVKETFG